MASSVVSICNQAIGRAGISNFIDSLDEASTEASVCSQFYEPCRDFVLAEFPWIFATKRAALASLATAPINWLYRYALPSDCLKAEYIVIPGSRTPLAKSRVPFEVSVENDVKVLYCDVAEAELVYISRVTNPNLFSPSFISALAWYLCSEIAFPLSAAAGIADKALNKYTLAMSAAATASINESQEDAEPESEFITGRN